MRYILALLALFSLGVGAASAQNDNAWLEGRIRAAMDPNADGRMTQSEYSAFHRHQPPIPFASRDRNGNGELEGAEYAEAVRELLNDAIDECDWDGDSYYRESVELRCAAEYYE
jgi:hypothetical protein